MGGCGCSGPACPAENTLAGPFTLQDPLPEGSRADPSLGSLGSLAEEADGEEENDSEADEAAAAAMSEALDDQDATRDARRVLRTHPPRRNPLHCTSLSAWLLDAAVTQLFVVQFWISEPRQRTSW